MFKFGVEVELYNIKRSDVCKAVSKVLSKNNIKSRMTEYRNKRRNLCYRLDSDIGTWHCKCDVSLHNDLNAKKPYSQEKTCELVTPVLTEKNLDLFYDIIDEIINAGGKCDYDHGCVIHVHIDDKIFSCDDLVHVLTYHHVLYPSIASKFKFTQDQIADRIKDLPSRFIDYINMKNNISLKDLQYSWYEFCSTEPTNKPYNKSRYSIVNLHSLFFNKTGVEFRYFKIDKLSRENVKGIMVFLLNILDFMINDKSNFYYYNIEDVINKFDISEEDKRDINGLLHT